MTSGAGDSVAGKDAGAPDELDAPIEPISRARRKSVAGLIAAGMLGLDEALGRKPREEAPIVVDANGDPVDIDSDGIEVSVATDGGDEMTVGSPALPRTPPLLPRAATGRRRRGGRAM